MTISEYPVFETGDGISFVYHTDLPQADVEEFIFSDEPKTEWSFPYGHATHERSVWYVESKLLFRSEIFPQGVPNRCKIEKLKNSDSYTVIGHSPIHYHCDSFEEAKQIAANYLKALEFYDKGLRVVRRYSF